MSIAEYGPDSLSRRRRVERELLVRARLAHLAGPGIAPLVASVGEEIVVEPGAVLYRQGEPAHHLYAFVSGELELTATGRTPLILASQSGLGALDILAALPRSFTATALGPVRATRVTADAYLDFLEEHFELVVSALAGVTDDIHQHSLALPPDGGFPLAAAPPAGDWPLAPLNLVQKIGLLRDSGVFRTANVQALVRLARLAREVRVDEGETVFLRGEAAGKFFLVAAGLVEAVHEAPALVATFGRGDLVCGYGALGAADDQYVATARSRTVVLSFDEEDFFDVMEEHFELTRSVLAGIATEHNRLFLEREKRTRAGPLG